jgi:hypothetical protein
MNPVTSGHEKLASVVKRISKKEGGEPAIFLSHTQNAKKDPLSYNDKIKFAQKSFGKMVKKSKSKTVIQLMQELEKKYNEVVFIAGSDRIPEYEKLLNKYNGRDYTFDSIKVVSAGERDPDASDVSGMSASKLRALAADGNWEQFKSGAPSGLNDKEKKSLYDTVRKGMNINEAKDDDPCWDDYEQIGTKMKDGKEVPNCVPKKSKKERVKRIKEMTASATSTANIPTGPESVGVKVEPDATFGKNPVFDCDHDTFGKCMMGKKKYGRWASFLGKENEFLGKMQNWMGQSRKNNNFIMRNKNTGEMVFARSLTEEKLDKSVMKMASELTKDNAHTEARVMIASAMSDAKISGADKLLKSYEKLEKQQSKSGELTDDMRKTRQKLDASLKKLLQSEVENWKEVWNSL